MKITQKQKDELISIAQTFLTLFIPLVGVTISQIDTNNFTKETATVLGLALLRSAIKALWQVIATRLAQRKAEATLDSTSL